MQACTGHPRAGNQFNFGFTRDVGEQGALQIGAAKRDVGRSPALFGRSAERHAPDFRQRGRVAKDDRRRPHGGETQCREHAKAVEDARGVGRELDSRAVFFQPRRLLEDADRIAAHGE